jgi:hypothetical protein
VFGVIVDVGVILVKWVDWGLISCFLIIQTNAQELLAQVEGENALWKAKGGQQKPSVGANSR